MDIDDETALSFHDSLLKRSDVALLEGGQWLNDKIIGFYFEYLEYNIFRDCVDGVSFITPDVTQFIKLYEGSELGIFLEPLRLHEKQLVVLAVNNNASMATAGGSHWSTLVYDRKASVFQHLDACGTMNSLPAKQCAERITPFLKAATEPTFCEVVPCPRQENGYDCGVYALCFAEAMCRIKLLSESESILRNISGSDVDKWRTDTKLLIEALAKTHNSKK